MEKTHLSTGMKRFRFVRTFLTGQLLVLLLTGPAPAARAFQSLNDYRITLRMQSTDIREVIREIQKKTNLSFVYNERDVEGIRVGDVHFSNEAVTHILDQVLKDTRLEYRIENGVIIISKHQLTEAVPQVQKKTVKGVVKDESGMALPGVAVKVKGTNVGVATDINGHYELMVDDLPGVVLEYTFIGMKPHEEKPGKRTVIDVVMHTTSISMDEVMVVAYGTTTKESFTGSAVSVKGDDVIKAAASKISPERALQGTVAGVRFNRGGGQPGALAQIQIRGIGSINEVTTPLYIVDGLPVSTGMEMFNPDDIESMTVLKDAAATSLYGSRASNGVIIITTKKGKEGATKFDITYERGWSSQAMPRALKDRWMSTAELTEYSLEALKNDYLYNREALPWQENSSQYEALQEEALKNAFSKLYGTAKIIHPDDPLDGSWGNAEYANADMSKYLSNPRSYDWYDAIFRKGTEDKMNFSVRGGGKSLNFYSSLGYLNQKGIARGSEFERISGRIAVNNSVNKVINFALSEGVTYSVYDQNSERDEASNPITTIRAINPSQPVYLPDGSLNMHPGFSYTTPNLIHNMENVLYKQKQFSSVSNLTLQVNFAPWLNFRTVNGADINYSGSKRTWTPESIDGETTNGQVIKDAGLWVNLVTSNTLNFNKSFSDHTVGVLVGYEAKKYHYDDVTAEGQNFNKQMYLGNAAVPSSVGESVSDDRLVSIISKLDYNYANKYFLSASFRRDGTSRFLAENRWGDFWSVSGAWTVSREKFMAFAEGWLDNLRLKLSYGTNGNQPSGHFNSLSLFAVNAKHNQQPATVLSSYGNPRLKWESSYTWNAGIDFSLWSGALRVAAEYYNKHTRDLINWATVSRMSGWGSMIVNEGELRNTGVEITLDSRNIKTEQFSWTTNFNISYMRAKVEELKDDDINGNYLTRQGEHMYTFYAQEWAGVDPATGRGSWYKNTQDENGNIIDRSITYDYNEASKKIVGKGYPDWFGGMTNKFTYKGVELSFLLTFTLGGKLWDNEMGYAVADGQNIGSRNFRRDAGKHWEKPGDHSDNPIVINNNPLNSSYSSTRRMMSSNHLRVKAITLGYSLPQRWLEAVRLSSARIYVNGNDVLTFFKSKYINPEVALNGDARTYGWPSLKSWRIGINIQF